MESFQYTCQSKDRFLLTWKKGDFRVKVSFWEEEHQLKMHIFAGGGLEKLEKIHFPVYE